jgi:hypothetical protein
VFPRSIALHVVALVLLGCSSTPDSKPSPAPASATPSGRTRCDFASVRPTYLPWLKAGEDVPPPRKYYGPDEAAWLDWRRPDWARQEEAPYYVVLRRDSQLTTSSGQLVPGTRLPGVAEPGRLYSGEVGFSPAIVWFLVSAPSCEWLTLQLSAPGMSREQAESEIAKIASSLRRSDSCSDQALVRGSEGKVPERAGLRRTMLGCRPLSRKRRCSWPL